MEFKNYNESLLLISRNFFILSIFLILLDRSEILNVNLFIGLNLLFSLIVLSGFAWLFFFMKNDEEKYNQTLGSFFRRGFLAGLILVTLLVGINWSIGNALYSVEIAFIGFIFLALIFYFLRIDSRFLILPAIILLGFIPLLLYIYQKALAENIAVFVYYFLVVGVVLQIIEMAKDREPKFDFSDIARYVYRKIKWIRFGCIFGIITLIFFGLDYSLKSGNFVLWKVTFAYLSALCLLIFFYSLIDKQ
ncbi:MAG: hypothetical protein PHN56_07325 [Candidatus Nanoarchaeia archaeon]|nr:hypothetical protein [Candidatus Nanoarchaeia archaeon]